MQDLVNEIGIFLIEQLRGELSRQGHNLTGALANSIEYEVTQATDSVKLTFSMNSYGLSLNTGIPAARIPYTRGSGRKSSQYIDGLRRWVRIKFGYSQQRAERVAFAIASKQKQQGYPLTGKTRWIDITLESTQDEINAFTRKWVAANIDDLINQFAKNRN